MTRGPRTGDRPIRRRPTAQRIRAARAFIGLERPEFARRSGIPAERLNYLENGKGDPKPEELDAIQQASGVPVWFLEHGFGVHVDAPVTAHTSDGRTSLFLGDLLSRVEQLERRQEELIAATVERLLTEAESAGRSVRETVASDRPLRRKANGG